MPADSGSDAGFLNVSQQRGCGMGVAKPIFGQGNGRGESSTAIAFKWVLVAVVVRLVWAFGGNAEVAGLLG